MLTINTNLSSLIAQNSLKTSTNSLNLAIERMTTGFKINHAKDDAANYAIATNMSIELSSLQITEDNTAMGIDLITTAEDTLNLIYERIERLRILQEQALNGTYGEDSLKAINQECNTLVDEVNRLYETAEYNGINLFLEPTTLPDGSVVITREADAKLDTKFKDLGITASHFEIYDINDNFVQAYDLEEDDTINNFLTTLQSHGFSTKLKDGEITIFSSTGLYVTGDLADELGINSKLQNYIASTEQSYGVYVETTSAQVSLTTVWTTTTSQTTQTDTIWMTTTTETTQTNTISVTTTTETTQTETIQIETTIGNTSTSSEAIKYTTTITTTVNATTTTALSTLGLTGNYYISSVSFNGSTTLGTLINNLNSAGITTTYSDGILTIQGQIVDESTIDATKRVANQTTFVAGQTYLISTSEDLVKLQDLVSAGVNTTSVTFEMTNSIDMAGVEFSGIGSSSHEFRGVFNGNNNVIKNLTINSTYMYNGLFGVISSTKIDSVALRIAI